MRPHRRADHDPRDSGGLRWLVTYADMVSLLLAFFVMLYSMSQISLEKFSRAAASLREEFGQRREEGQRSPRRSPPPPREQRLEEEIQSIEDEIVEYIAEAGLGDLVRAERQPRGLVISVLSDNVLFSAGEAELRAPALRILDKIAGLLTDIDHHIAVEGHTCDLPIRTARFPSNWELSAARACTVVRYLTDRWRIPPTRLAATGYADSRPVAPNTSEEGRVLNRRVDLVIVGREAAPPAATQEPPR